MWRNSCSWLFLPPDGKHPLSQSFYLRLCLLLTERKLDVFSLTGWLKVGLYWPPVVSHLNSLRWFSNCTPGWVSTLWHHFYYRCNVAHATAPGRSEVKVTGSGLLVNQRETDGNITGRSRWSCFDFNDRNWKRISTKQKTKKKSVLSSRHRQPRVQLQSSCGAVGPTAHSQVTALCLVIH